MIRVLLVNHVNRPEEMNEPLGVQVLAATLSARFHDAVETRVSVIDSRYGQAGLFADIRAFRPHLVGVSSKISQLEPLLELYRFTSSLAHAPLFVVGDQLATLGAVTLLERSPDALCVIGEGEDALSGIVEVLLDAGGHVDHDTLCRALLANGTPNCAFVLDGRQEGTARKSVALSRAVPPSRPFIDRAVAESWIIHAEASRGCPWGKCSFCYVGQKYERATEWRPFPIETVVEDLANLSRSGARTVFFTDEDFVGPDWERILALCEAIVAAKQAGRVHADMAFFVSSSAYTLLKHGRAHGLDGTRELLTKLKTAGVREIFLGIESGCDGQLRRYKKGVTVEQNLAAIALVRSSGIDLDLGFLPFDPWATLEEVAENLDFLRRADLVHQPVRLLKKVLLTPATPIAERWDAEHGETPVDLNELTLEYDIKDARVAALAELSHYRWQLRASDIYKTQASRRTQLSENGASREEATARLCAERADDFDFLARCAQAILRHPGRWRDALADVVATDRVLGPLARQASAVELAPRTMVSTEAQ